MLENQKKFDEVVVPGATKANSYLDMKTSDVPSRVTTALITLPGGARRELGRTVGYIDGNILTGFAALNAKVDGLVGALAAVNKGEPFDQAKLLASIEDATKRGVAAAIDSITREETTKVTLTDEEK